ncbi:MAG: hypothetical protein M1819_006073 [Sarea resinae]|nr:MAG: hypothetical protein M1819_006073 [Sarea resinae]
MESQVAQNLGIIRYGLSEVYSADDPAVDVVLVHGLNGSPYDTWATKKPEVFWPAQLLPPFAKSQKLRVLVYGYDADVQTFMGGASKDKIHNHAENLLAELNSDRSLRDATRRPIIFVCHSLGGIVVKRALNMSTGLKDKKRAHLRNIVVSTYGILFLGTPHNGSDFAKWGVLLQSICSAALPKKFMDSSPQLVEALKNQSETLQNINRDFENIQDTFHIFCFHEAKPTDLKGLSRRFIVDEDSAAPSMGHVERAAIAADHSHMCKFESVKAPGFPVVVEAIKRYATEAPEAVANRWPSEQETRQLELQKVINELDPSIQTARPSFSTSPQMDSSQTFSPNQSIVSLPASERPQLAATGPITITSVTPSSPSEDIEPFFIVPPGFRRTTFVGMGREMTELDRWLLDSRTRSFNASVLLHCLPGGGKTHLAWHYINERKNDFPGGIFWIRAKSREEMLQDVLSIDQKAVLKDLSESILNSYELDQRSSVERVRNWFDNRRGWLLVIDGISIEREDDIVQLQQIIPNSPGSSLIYTSRADSLANDLNAIPVRVEPLSEDEGRQLLFEELGLLRPSKAQIKRATELVRQMGCLPLFIHAVGRRLDESKEPLQKYHIRSYSLYPRLETPYMEIMEDLRRLKYNEARNLIDILCFFGQRVPVEMVQFGKKALRLLRIEIKSSYEGSRRDINMTFGILMKHALISRNDSDDHASSHSQESQSQESRGSLMAAVDVLTLHSVVQGFCRDLLNREGRLALWLSYAVTIFCSSFDEADKLIKSNTDGLPLVTDYREYEIHGKKLAEHVGRYRVKHPTIESTGSQLQSTLSRIAAEIRNTTPASSQEVLSGTRYMTSVFSRASSCSSSGPETPPCNPSELSVSTESTYSKEHFESPVSMVADVNRTAMPPQQPTRWMPFSRDPSYPADWDGVQQRMPVRPYPEQDMPLVVFPAAPQEDWHSSEQSPGYELKPPYPQEGVHSPGRQNSHFREMSTPRPTPSSAWVSTVKAKGVVSPPREPSREGITGSSEAVNLLSAMHKSSPPPSRGNRSISRGRSSSRTPPSLKAQLAHTSAHTPSNASPLTQNQSALSQEPPSSQAPLPAAMQRVISADNLMAGTSGRFQPSPLAATFVPQRRTSHSVPNDRSPFPPPTSSGEVRYGLPQQLPGLHYANQSHFSSPHLPLDVTFDPRLSYPVYYQPPQFVPAPMPLPVVNETAGTGKRSLPQDFRGHGRHSRQDTFQVPRQDLTPYLSGSLPPVYPRGYASQPTSQPMSREGSNQSTFSIAGVSEPTPYPTVFPSPSPRDRMPDGGPVRKSPKFDGTCVFIDPRIPKSEEILPFPNEWATNNQTSPPTSHAALSTSMSRSSSGPGIAVETANQGLGIVQFGDLDQPVDISAARARVVERERQLAFERGLFRPTSGWRTFWRRDGSAVPQPLPSLPRVNVVVPSSNTSPEDLRGRPVSIPAELVALDGRLRGMSSPLQPDLATLGIGFDARGVPVSTRNR